MINKLKGELPFAKGSSLPDHLNSLSELYWWFPRPNPDSIFIYARQAYTESSRNNYLPGLSRSLLNLGVSELYKRNYPSAESYLHQGINLSERIHDNITSGWSYLYLGWVLFLKNDYIHAEDAYKKSATYFQEAGEDEGKGRICAYRSILYTAMGDYGKGFEYCHSSLQVREKMNDRVCILFSYKNFGNLYKAAGDYETALEYYRKSLQYAKVHKIDWDEDEEIGTIYCRMNNMDSSFYYLRQSLNKYPEDPNIWLSLSETYLAHKDYDSALKISLLLINSYRESNDRFHLMSAYLDAGKANAELKNDFLALKYTLEGLSLARQAGSKQSMINGYQLLSVIYNHLGKTDSAYLYLEKYTLLKDSVLTRKFVSRMQDYANNAENERGQAQLLLLGKDNKIKEQQLKQKTLINTILIGSIFSFIILGIIIFRNILLRRRNEKLQNIKKEGELQQQALRAQMNPHFLFNSLNSINHFILLNNKTQASEYLTKFSKLVRLILQNSQNSLITLESEIESLHLYLELESLRFSNHYKYKISVSDELEKDVIKVPPLIIQPYVENAIWHGLMHKENEGQLDIELWREENNLFIKVADNGIGRKHAREFQGKSNTNHKSLGLKITEERIAMLQRTNEKRHAVIIHDLVNPDGSAAGTEVIIKMPVIYD